MSGAFVAGVSPGSAIDGTGVETGDELVSVNGVAPTDIIQYQQLVDSASVAVQLRRKNGDLYSVDVTKEEGSPLGLSIDSAVFDRIRTCDNHCTFCFIYQLPKGLRRSLYVKDDDFRLSFLYGNYTTLTRFTEFDLERVVEERLSPLYVSIHTTNPQLRASMLRNPRGATSLRWLREILSRDIVVHGQVVVCPGVNDGVYLEQTLEDVLTQYADIESVAVVPLGISDFSNEPTMRAHTPQEALRVVTTVATYQAVAQARLGRRLFHASDEYYLMAGVQPPELADLDSVDTAENGIGMVAAFADSFLHKTPMANLGTGFFQSVDGAPALEYRAPRGTSGALKGGSAETVILTGEYAAPLLSNLLQRSGLDEVRVVTVVNHYFGGNIKVAGLLTGSDIARALESLPESSTVLLPDVCLNEGRFIDGSTLEDLPRHVNVVTTTGVALREVLEQLGHKAVQS